MPRAKRHDLHRIHIMLNKNELAKLELYWGQTIGVSEAIRIAITRFLREHEDRARSIIDNNAAEKGNPAMKLDTRQ